jgi:hypothetical protein
MIVALHVDVATSVDPLEIGPDRCSSISRARSSAESRRATRSDERRFFDVDYRALVARPDRRRSDACTITTAWLVAGGLPSVRCALSCDQTLRTSTGAHHYSLAEFRADRRSGARRLRFYIERFDLRGRHVPERRAG